MSIQTDTECAQSMTRLRTLRTTIFDLQQQLNQHRREQKLLTTQVGDFLTRTNRESVRLNDLIVQAQNTTVSGKVNILTRRAATAQQVLDSLAQVGVIVSPEQWGTMVQSMRTTTARVRRDVRLITA